MRIDLSGLWRFRLDPEDVGVSEGWHTADLVEQVTLPGSTDTNRKGTENTELETSRLTRSWTYAGPAWYVRDIDIPASWEGRRVLLDLERVQWETRVWVDGLEAGMRDSLSVPHVYDLTAHVRPGRHRIAIRVDNRMKYVIHHSQGGPVWTMAVTDESQTNWNGIVGDISLRAEPDVSIEGVIVRPDLAAGAIQVDIRAYNTTLVERVTDVRVLVNGRRVAGRPMRVDAGGVTLELAFPIGDLELWDEFNPVVHQIDVRVGVAGWHGTFGLRDCTTDGRKLRINQRRVFLRGTIENAVWPRTGYSPTDVASWRDVWTSVRDHGFNHIRFHSNCPPRAAFTAADELGLILQVELPLWDGYGNIWDDDRRTVWLREEALRIVDEYGNHPSFCILCMGNEIQPRDREDDPFLASLVKELQQYDARRLYTSTAHPALLTHTDDIFVTAVAGDGQIRSPERTSDELPQAAYDFDSRIEGLDRPVISHEVGDFPAMFPNLGEAAKYTGPVEARHLDVLRENLGRKGLLDKAEAFRRATGHRLVEVYKHVTEGLLRTRELSGFQAQGLQDYPGEGIALVGVLDAFWESKGLVSPERWRSFAGPIVALARLERFVWTSDELLRVPVELAHFGRDDLTGARVAWSLSAGEEDVHSGAFGRRDIPAGGHTDVGTIEVDLGSIDAPARLRLRVSLEGTDIRNEWKVWVYEPSPSTEEIPTFVTWASDLAELLDAGGAAILMPPPGALKQQVPARWESVGWSTWLFPQQPTTLGILADPAHPIFARFPTDEFAEWQWYEPLSDSTALVLDGLPADLAVPLAFIDDFHPQFNRRLAGIVEMRVGNGRLLICTLDLASKSGVASRQLLAAIHSYVASSAFAPTCDVGPGEIEALLRPAAVTARS